MSGGNNENVLCTLTPCVEGMKSQLFQYDSTTMLLSLADTIMCIDDNTSDPANPAPFHSWYCEVWNRNQLLAYNPITNHIFGPNKQGCFGVADQTYFNAIIATQRKHRHG